MKNIAPILVFLLGSWFGGAAWGQPPGAVVPPVTSPHASGGVTGGASSAVTPPQPQPQSQGGKPGAESSGGAVPEKPKGQ